jgi:hypothetical protein
MSLDLEPSVKVSLPNQRRRLDRHVPALIVKAEDLKIVNQPRESKSG